MHTEQEISDVVIKDSMNKLVSDPNLRDLQKLIGRFNTFRVLGIENMEIRHSRILAWLLTPSESHGLGDHFLRRYLMSLSSELENGLPEAVVLGITPFNSVEISREWKNIDLIIDISTTDEKWLFI